MSGLPDKIRPCCLGLRYHWLRHRHESLDLSCRASKCIQFINTSPKVILFKAHAYFCRLSSSLDANDWLWAGQCLAQLLWRKCVSLRSLAISCTRMEASAGPRPTVSAGPCFQPLLGRSTSCVVVRLRKREQVVLILSLGARCEHRRILIHCER